MCAQSRRKLSSPTHVVWTLKFGWKEQKLLRNFQKPWKQWKGEMDRKKKRGVSQYGSDTKFEFEDAVLFQLFE